MSFTFRKMTPADMDQAHAMVSDWDVVRQTSRWPWPPDRAFTEGRFLSNPSDNLMSIAVFDGDTLLGCGGLLDGEFGLMVARPHWRRGVGRAIAEHLIPPAFADGADVIRSEVWIDNPGSQALHAALGFTETGRTISDCRARGERVEAITYRLTRDAWEART